jgi:hypothetical protein
VSTKRGQDHRSIVELLRDGKSHEELRAYLDEQNIDPETGKPKLYQAHHMVVYDAHHAFHKTSANSLWPEVPPPKKLSWRDRAHRILWGQSAR